MADTQGVIEAARAAAPAAVGQQPAPVMAPVAAAPAAEPQGFGAPAQPNGFAAPQPVAQPALVQQATPAIETDSARTAQQFEKLSDTNQRLAQTNELLRQELQRMQQTRQQQLPQQQYAPAQQQAPVTGQPSAMPKLSDYIEVDPRTGERFVNEAKFNSAVAEIYQKASRAEQVVQQYVQTAEQREVDRMNREAYSAFPELNPTGGKFDPEFAKNTRAFVLDSLMNPQDYGGRQLSFKDAAEMAAQRAGRQTRSVANATPTPAVSAENQVQKEQAAASVPSVPQQFTQSVDQEQAYANLVKGTRLGADEALALRLKNSPHRLADLESQS